MGKNSSIQWTDDTFNPWWGCEKVSPGCAHCYAESWAKRTGHAVWGREGARRFFGEKHWKEPLGWNGEEMAECPKCGDRQLAGWRGAHSQTCSKCAGPRSMKPVRRRVFCASMADCLEDREDLTPHLARLLGLVFSTPNLDWLLLSKRPGNWRGRVAAAFEWIREFEPGIGVMGMLSNWLHGSPPHNVWMGTTVEDQARAEERIPVLLEIPARVRFLSCEPLLGALDLGGAGALPVYRTVEGPVPTYCGASGRLLSVSEGGRWHRHDGNMRPWINWVICGGESGPGARPMQAEWARGLRDQCVGAGVPFFFKQWGEWLPDGQNPEIGGVSGPTQATRVGKKAAGRLLDGREWSEVPVV